MLSFLSILVLSFLARTLVVQAGLPFSEDDFRFNIDTVRQCEPVSLAFEGDLLRGAMPTTLRVIPFNGSAYDLPLPPVNVTDTGVTVSFLPMRENTTFIATLDDATGDNTSRVSDISRVQAGSSASCLSDSDQNRPHIFELVGENDPTSHPAQCQNFTVSYNASIVGPPSVRIYSPLFAAFNLNQTSDDGEGLATYMMAAFRGTQYVLLFGDSAGEVMETTPLMSVLGDSTSSLDCFTGLNFTSFADEGQQEELQESTENASLNQTTIIGLAIGGGVIALLACALVAYLVWERRRRRRVIIRFDPSSMEKRGDNHSPTSPAQSNSPSEPPSPPVLPYAGPVEQGGYIQNPSYARYSVASWGNPASPLQSQAINPSERNAPNWTAGNVRPSEQPSFQSFEDIERILNNQEQRLREEQSSRSSSGSSPAVLRQAIISTTDQPRFLAVDGDGDAPPSPFSVTISQPVVGVRAIPQRGHLRDPSDIPREASIDNPFGDDRATATLSTTGAFLNVPPAAAGPGQGHFSNGSATSFDGPDALASGAKDVNGEPARNGSKIFISGLPVEADSSSFDDPIDEYGASGGAMTIPRARGLGRGNGEAL